MQTCFPANKRSRPKRAQKRRCGRRQKTAARHERTVLLLRFSRSAAPDEHIFPRPRAETTSRANSTDCRRYAPNKRIPASASGTGQNERRAARPDGCALPPASPAKRRSPVSAALRAGKGARRAGRAGASARKTTLRNPRKPRQTTKTSFRSANPCRRAAKRRRHTAYDIQQRHTQPRERAPASPRRAGYEAPPVGRTAPCFGEHRSGDGNASLGNSMQPDSINDF